MASFANAARCAAPRRRAHPRAPRMLQIASARFNAHRCQHRNEMAASAKEIMAASAKAKNHRENIRLHCACIFAWLCCVAKSRRRARRRSWRLRGSRCRRRCYLHENARVSHRSDDGAQRKQRISGIISNCHPDIKSVWRKYRENGWSGGGESSIARRGWRAPRHRASKIAWAWQHQHLSKRLGGVGCVAAGGR